MNHSINKFHTEGGSEIEVRSVEPSLTEDGRGHLVVKGGVYFLF